MTAPSAEALEQVFTSALGPEAVKVLDASDPRARGQRVPLPCLSPRTVEQVSEALRAAALDGIGLVPVGGGTALRRSPEPAPPICLLSLERMDQVVEHAVEDLVLAAEAGLLLGRAQAAVAAHGQLVPLSPPRSARATLGGIVACAAEGPTFNAWGAVRDQVLGVQVVHGDGRITRAGGRVVKNVTGYDLSRLYTGSRGVLGVITEVTLRLRPRPRAVAHVCWQLADPAAAWRSGMALRRDVPAIGGLTVLAGRAARDRVPAGGALLAATLHGEPELVEALRAACTAHSPGVGPDTVEPGTLPALADPAPDEGEAWLRAAALPGDGERLLEAVLRHGPDTLVLDVHAGMLDAGHADAGWLAPAEEVALGRELSPLRAQVDRPADPDFHRRRFNVFPSARPDGLAIMAGIRRALDPQGVLNPGRSEIRR